MDYSFYINRLKRMSPLEILYRVSQKGSTTLEHRFMKFYKFNFAISMESDRLLKNLWYIPSQEELLKKADKLCENRIDLFALKDLYLGRKINYHKDYKSGKLAPSNVFGKKINYRSTDKVGDIKYIWELSRHLFLPVLAIAYSRTKEEKYLIHFSAYLGEWLEQNPFMMGVNWSSSLELGIRLVNWTICWHIVQDKIDPVLREKWIISVNQHCWYINKNYSKYSSANNHLIGEAAGLFVATTSLPQFANSKNWQKKAFRILVQQSTKQNHPDGINKEQAISYQYFVLEFLTIAGYIGEKFGWKFPYDYWNNIGDMLNFCEAIKDTDGNFPQYGDEDDGHVLDKSIRCLKKQRFKKKNKKAFSDGGYYLLEEAPGKKEEQKMIFDCGDLGYTSLAAHGHADALSFYFSAGGMPIFIDPGTYAYHANTKWRDYFRSTRAHNTLTVDGLNQSVMAGNFMWSKKAQSSLINHLYPEIVAGTHDGYNRLKDPVTHSRQIRLDKEREMWIIRDQIDCQKDHNICLYFHLDPRCKAYVSGSDVTIYFDKGECSLMFEEDVTVSLHHGESSPPLGWYSPSYDVKVPTTTIKAAISIHSSHTIITKFAVRFDHRKC